MSNTPSQVRVEVQLSNGERLIRRFDDCESAWMWERETKRKHKNRRAIADRLSVVYSFYVGCTCHGNTYGGMLTGAERHVDMQWEKLMEFRRAERQPDYKGTVCGGL